MALIPTATLKQKELYDSLEREIANAEFVDGQSDELDVAYYEVEKRMTEFGGNHYGMLRKALEKRYMDEKGTLEGTPFDEDVPF